MCIIIDSDRLGLFLAQPFNENAEPIHKWLKGTGKLVYSTGDAFSKELSDNGKARFQELVRRGRAKYFSDEEISDMAATLRQNNSIGIKSKDHHVLALAKVSGARLLYTGDKALKDDFKNRDIIDNPRGRIYSDKRQRRLLTSTVCSI